MVHENVTVRFCSSKRNKYESVRYGERGIAGGVVDAETQSVVRRESDAVHLADAGLVQHAQRLQRGGPHQNETPHGNHLRKHCSQVQLLQPPSCKIINKLI